MSAIRQSVFFLAALSIAFSISTAPVSAKDSPLTAEQEVELLDIASAFAEPPAVEVAANLLAPTTFYAVRFATAEKARIETLVARAKEAGFSMSVRVETSEDDWNEKISCGVFSRGYSDAGWSHPEGEPPKGCPHEEGTSHTGTISVKPTVHLGMVPANGTTTVLTAMWEIKCTYEGSESGTTACTSELESFGGFYGAMFSERYGFSTEDNDVDPWNKAWVYVGVTVVIGGLGYAFFRRKTSAERGEGKTE
jgi:hypothetical protein